MELGIVAALGLVAYLAWAWTYVNKRKTIVVLDGQTQNSVDASDIIAMPRELTIRIVEDAEVNYEAYSDLTLKLSDLINGTYKIPARFLKEKKNIIDADGGEPERVVEKSNVDLNLYASIGIDAEGNEEEDKE